MKPSVLIVDDDANVRRSLTSIIERAGYAVTTADEAVPAMQLDAAFDIVVVDFNMHTATGDTVVKHFKTRFGPNVFCVVLSGEDDDDIHARCLAAGADVFMLKPALPSSLRRCLADGLVTLRAAA